MHPAEHCSELMIANVLKQSYGDQNKEWPQSLTALQWGSSQSIEPGWEASDSSSDHHPGYDLPATLIRRFTV